MNKSTIETNEDLEIVLQNIISPNPNNADIKLTSELIKAYRKNLNSVEGFLFHIKNNQNSRIRQLAAILLNKKIETHWQKLESNIQANIRKLLMDLISVEKDFLVAKAIANLMFKISKVSLITEEWNDLHEYIFSDPSVFNSTQAHLFELNLYIIAELIEGCPLQLKHKYLQVNNIIILALTQGSAKVK